MHKEDTKLNKRTTETGTKKTEMAMENARFQKILEEAYKDLRFNIIKLGHISENINAYIHVVEGTVSNVDDNSCIPVYCSGSTLGYTGIPTIAKQYEMFKKAVNAGDYGTEAPRHELVMLPEGAQWPLFLRWFAFKDNTVIYTLDRNYLLENIKRIAQTLTVGNGNTAIPDNISATELNAGTG
jgi:hypothetical protein